MAGPLNVDDERRGRGAAELLQRFKDSFRPTPPVSFVRGMPAPTAMSWLRRRGPQVPHAALYRLFRQRQIRLFDGARVIRVHAARPLRNGELLLYPAELQPRQQPQPQAESKARAAAEGAAEPKARGDAGGLEQAALRARAVSHAAAGPGPGSRGAVSGVRDARQSLFAKDGEDEGLASGAEMAAAAAPPPPPPPLALTPERVRRWVLGVHPGLVFINKPAGVRVHGRAAGDEGGGGRGGAGAGPPRSQTLEGLMRAALRYGEDDEPKLVHRLDEQASGVMVVARNADSAAWLSAAFRSKAAQALAEAEGEEAGGGHGEHDLGGSGAWEADARGLFVRRTYWAFLAGELQPRQSGRIRYPVLVDESYQPAVTSYRVRAVGSGVSWVELTPETGRRHQLRVHCAHRLGAPIIGDARYGYRGLERPQKEQQQQPAAASTAPRFRPPEAALPLRDRLPPEWWALLGEDPRVVRRRAGRAAAAAAPPPPPSPILLHARELLVKRPGKSAVVAVAPLPRYIRQLMEALGWPLPR